MTSESFNNSLESVQPVVTAMMGKIIDYAGLFPPARLPLDTSISNFIAYRSGGFNWMLSRFICTLPLLHQADELFPPAKPVVPVSLISPHPLTDVEGLAVMAESVARLNGDSKSIVVDQIEAKWPGSKLDGNTLFQEALHALSVIEGLRELFVEVPWQLDFALDDFVPILTGLAPSAPFSIGLKIRTGGTDAAAFPPPANVLRFLRHASDASLAFKATAGLHHPFRHFDPSVNTLQYGFVNMILAATAIDNAMLPDTDVIDLLDDQSEINFKFFDDSINWRDTVFSLDAIQHTRDTFFRGFGSCSFVEPVADLCSLNLLPVPDGRAP